MAEPLDISGLMAEFDDPDALRQAARCVRDAGVRRLETFTPHPIEGLDELVGPPDAKLPMAVFAGGIGGAIVAFGVQTYSWVWSYPINIGGRPAFSWPAFVPVTFEFAVLSAAFAAFLTMLALNRLPRYHHPVFEVPGFVRASSDRFFLMVGADDASFDRQDTRELLLECGALAVSEVPCA